MDGLFLSSFSVFKFLERENEFKVTEELLNFFVNVFNFHDKFDPSTTQRSKQLRNIVFCKTTDEVEKINVLYKNSNTYKFINNAIPNNLTESDENEIINEVKIWYASNDDTFLDNVISRYHEKATHIKQLCVPIKGEEWSIIDIMVRVDDSSQELGENGYLQKTTFHQSQVDQSFENLEAIMNKGSFSAIWWAKYFGLYSCLNNVNGFSQNMYFGSHDLVKEKSPVRSKNGCALEIIRHTHKTIMCSHKRC